MDENVFDRYKEQMNQLGKFGQQIHNQLKTKIKILWRKQLEKL